ncbi:MAG TPA: acyl-CoA dehydrogenase family protein [Jatrophihabitans sp.]|nr:acyl-CoA dehydrogenase family protein [Jatrophihabitans sp.]
MDFELSDSQRELAGLARQIFTDQVTQPRLREVETGQDHFDRDLWAALGEAGVLSAALPESAGGGGLGLAEQCSVLIETGRAVAPVPYLWSIAVGAAALGEFGATQLAERAGTGELVVTAALTEDFVDLFEAPVTRAEPADGGWRLDGAKALVPALPVADVVLVPASTADGVGVFVVETDAAGVTVERQVLVDGDSAGSLELAGAVAHPLGGRNVLDWLVSRATVGLAAYQVGVLERALELTAEYARGREQFGRPIGSFQAVAQRLADAYIDVEAVRLTTWEAAWRLGQGLPATAEIATAKFWAADAGHRVAHTAVHVHGGTGIDVDAPAHRYFTAAKRTEFTLGGATAQLRRLGAELAATPA